MKTSDQNRKIECPIFIKQDKIISSITERINKSDQYFEKARLSEELKKEINILLKCEKYEEKCLDCKRCQLFANLRNKTVGILLLAGELT